MLLVSSTLDIEALNKSSHWKTNLQLGETLFQLFGLVLHIHLLLKYMMLAGVCGQAGGAGWALASVAVSSPGRTAAKGEGGSGYEGTAACKGLSGGGREFRDGGGDAFSAWASHPTPSQGAVPLREEEHGSSTSFVLFWTYPSHQATQAEMHMDQPHF
ncbi:hypothetical protein Taro_022106 [Colocasia esculenta]|uniref:Uncharacterized protein n=1 Tax=Colocasia esculenta TaxID=4460 RepID=A0A843UTI0_COLES|nr:hypothetical protein [Colocasia esculenta]